MTPATGTITAEFAHEWERERELKLRKRFRWYAWVVIAFNALGLVLGIVTIFLPFFVDSSKNIKVQHTPAPNDASLAFFLSQGGLLVIASGITIILYAYGLRFAKQHKPKRDLLIQVVTWLILVSGVIGFAAPGVAMLILADASPAAFVEAAADSGNFYQLGLNGALGVLFTHLFASFFLPWTARESLRPIWPLLYANTVFVAIVAIDRPMLILLAVVFAVLVALPGTLVAWWKNSRFRNKVHNRALRKRYGDIKRDLVSAQQIHEDLFPHPIERPELVMRYAYTPMRQIGGDYLYTRLHHAEPNNHDSPIDAAHLVVLDVTGHGVPAALTVNRIHGEIDRQLALNPILSPARLLAALNEYLHLTLAARSVYATALCLRIDLENDAVTWASAGHPPAFLRTVDNRLHHLRPTTIVLGAVPPDAFEHEEDTLSFTPGDTILAYTDGATETTDTNGRMVRVQGLEAIFHAINFPRNAPHTADATAEVARRLDDTRQGPNHDDTLLVQIARPLTTHKPNTPERPDEHPRTQPADAR